MIDRLRAQQSTKLVCQAFGVLRSSFYQYKRARLKINPFRIKLKAQIKRLFRLSRGSLGSRGIRNLLINEGTKVGRYLIRRLMKQSNLVSKQPKAKPYAQYQAEHLEVPNKLARAFKPDRPNQIWTGDITYIWTGKSWCYLAVVLDLYARKVVGWSFAAQADKQLVCKALEHAWLSRGRPKGLLFHSDQGVQYKSHQYRQKLCDYGIEQSMSLHLAQRCCSCWDNAPTERLFRSLKYEWIPKSGYQSEYEAKLDIAEFLMGYFNQIRPHQYNSGLSPSATENKLKLVSTFS